MLDFHLPFLSGSNSIKAALAETIEAGKSGLLYETESGELRIASYAVLIQALQGGVCRLEELEEESFEPVVPIVKVPPEACVRVISAAQRRFGFKGFVTDGIAQLVSVSELLAGPYNAFTTGTRCKRPDRPAHILPRDWYHYYPPTPLPLVIPNTCNVCGSPV